MASSARIDELRKKFEENPRRYFAPLANEYRKAGDVNQAIAICREYLPQQPGHMSGHIVYGQALYEARQFDEAKTVFETALSLDPENLIALRHLGDIALIVGDSEGARVWYGRVLEADPRNEEIQAQLATLARAASTAPTPIASASVPEAPPPTPPLATAPPSPLPPAVSAAPAKPSLGAAAPTVVMAAVPRPGQPPTKIEEPVERPLETVTPESPTAEIRLDTIPTHAPPATPVPIEMALGLEPTAVPQSPEPAAAAPTLEIDTPVSTAKEAPPLDSFSLEGLQTTSLASASASPASPPPPAAAPLPEIELATPEPAPAGASEAAAPALIPLPDLDFGSVTPAPAPPPPVEAEIPLLDIGELPAPPMANAPASTPSAPEVETLTSEPAPAAVASEPTPAEQWSPPPVASEIPEAAEQASPVPEPGPFVTETMAELYLQQGHRDEALRVYRALLEQRPNDASLREKVASLVPAAEPVASALHEGAEPTIRETLNFMALRRPGFRPEPPGQNGTTPQAAESSAAGGDGLTPLFGNVQIAAEDESAAMALALAFTNVDGMSDGAAAGAQSPGIAGAPARRASSDLSLDTVFGGGAREAPAGPTPSNFSFDQFFSQRATAEHSTASGGPAGAAAESRDDVAQFTQWLEGLKQR